MKALLKKLTDVFGPSGHEDAIREVIRKEAAGPGVEIKVDALGNLIVHKRPSLKAARKPWGKRIMVAAHMDEIGLVVTHVDSHGFVRFASIGGVVARNLPGARVRFVDGTCGIIGIEPIDKPNEVPGFDRMYIDVGATSGKDCPVKVGDVAGFDRPFLELGDRVAAKSIDDRVGCAVALEALHNLKKTEHDVYFAFTTQEEVGTRGAQTSAYGIDPDLGFSIDVTAWGDSPGIRHFPISIGAGPAIKIRDGGMISDPRIVKWMTKTADKAKIKYQREVLLGGTTDARAMQLVRAGVPVGCVSVPCRYVHTPSEMVDISDVEEAARLVAALLSSPVEL